MKLNFTFSYFHTNNIFHHDLKSANIFLIEKNEKIKITQAYLDPDVYLKKEYYKLIDFYSF